MYDEILVHYSGLDALKSSDIYYTINTKIIKKYQDKDVENIGIIDSNDYVSHKTDPTKSDVMST